MPEVWIPYGEVEVSIDIKSENLAGIYENNYSKYDVEQLNNYEKLTTMKNNITILDECNSPGSISIVNKLLSIFENNNKINEIKIIKNTNNIKINNNIIKNSKKNIVIKQINKFQKNELNEFIKNENIIFISQSKFEPLFGFTGGPITLAKVSNENLIKDAFYSEEIFLPEPGKKVKKSTMIEDEYEKYSNVLSIEIIEDNNGINNCEIGTLNQAHNNSIDYLMNNIKPIQKKFDACIISCDDVRRNLTNSLNGIWNNYTTINDKGNITLLAECSDGIGSQALKKYLLNQINIKNILQNNEYVNGLENIIYLQNIINNFSISIVSTLPNYYLENRLKFRSYNKANEALQSIIRRKGKSSFISVILQGNNIMLKSE